VGAYGDLLSEWFDNASEVVSMDRYRHGIRPTMESAPPEPSHEDQMFDSYQSMYFKVSAVDVVDQYNAPVPMDYREHLMVYPVDAVHSWASRLRPTGGVNKLQVIIKDAHVMPVGGSAQVASNRRYDAGMVIEMRIVGRGGQVLASVSSSSAQVADISEAAGIEARQAMLNQTLARLIDSINGDLETKMARNFSPYIDYTTTAQASVMLPGRPV
jgi:hypothetical protein